MPVVTMKVPAVITRKIGTNGYGEPLWSAPVPTRCAVVKLTLTDQHTTVRADSSGSRGHADETTSDSVLLFSKTTDLVLGDKIEVAGVTLRVTTVRPRYSAMSRLDHYEVRCDLERA